MLVDDGDDLAPLAAGAAALGLTLDEEQLARFSRYRALLLEWNTRVNLTAITDPAAIATRHFLDSLTCLLALPAEWRERAITLLDIGAGAGFPGLALAIALPAWRVTLLEATSKKVRFLDAVIADLALPNATALAGRAEAVAHQPAYRGRFDAATARAVAALSTLLEYCSPFTKVGGYVVAPKKGDLAEEIAHGRLAALALGARLLDPVPVTLPTLADGRVLLAARQVRPCPPQYPRAAGAPAKRPLGG
jgi:16S rRNA (guanine527-N7)-methyltransferase